MRIRTLFLIALFGLPAVSNGQIRVPVRPGRTPVEPASLPPEAPIVGKELAYRRSRWTTEAYTMVSSMQLPTSSGIVGTTALGAGTHAAYRVTEHFSSTMDLTASPFGSAIFETAEVGSRYTMTPLSEEYRGVQPFVDVRGAYMHMYDSYTTPAAIVGGTTQQFAEVGRYSHGVGGVAGAGLELLLTRTLGVTTELSAMRTHMTAYRMTGNADLPVGMRYSMTSVRFAVGIKYNPIQSLLAQNPTR
jgi:hypothetical protein